MNSRWFRRNIKRVSLPKDIKVVDELAPFSLAKCIALDNPVFKLPSLPSMPLTNSDKNKEALEALEKHRHLIEIHKKNSTIFPKLNDKIVCLQEDNEKSQSSKKEGFTIEESLPSLSLSSKYQGLLATKSFSSTHCKKQEKESSTSEFDKMEKMLLLWIKEYEISAATHNTELETNKTDSLSSLPNIRHRPPGSLKADSFYGIPFSTSSGLETSSSESPSSQNSKRKLMFSVSKTDIDVKEELNQERKEHLLWMPFIKEIHNYIISLKEKHGSPNKLNNCGHTLPSKSFYFGKAGPIHKRKHLKCCQRKKYGPWYIPPDQWSSLLKQETSRLKNTRKKNSKAISCIHQRLHQLISTYCQTIPVKKPQLLKAATNILLTKALEMQQAQGNGSSSKKNKVSKMKPFAGGPHKNIVGINQIANSQKVTHPPMSRKEIKMLLQETRRSRVKLVEERVVVPPPPSTSSSLSYSSSYGDKAEENDDSIL